jgi:hypothetical protein
LLPDENVTVEGVTQASFGRADVSAGRRSAGRPDALLTAPWKRSVGSVSATAARALGTVQPGRAA